MLSRLLFQQSTIPNLCYCINSIHNILEPTSHDDIQPTLPTLEKENVEVKGTALETNLKVKTAALENNAMHNSTGQ